MNFIIISILFATVLISKNWASYRNGTKIKKVYFFGNEFVDNNFLNSFNDEIKNKVIYDINIHELSKVFEVHLITEGEFKEEICLACKGLGIDKNSLHFLDLTPEARKRCHNQGDWRFYIDYRKWQKQVRKERRAQEKTQGSCDC